jgi:predicted transcriptional regulator
MTPARLKVLREYAEATSTSEAGVLLIEAIDAYEIEKRRADGLVVRLDAMRAGSRQFVRELVAKPR